MVYINCIYVFFQAREFKANPIPDLSPDLPERRSRGPTRPKPFPLETDERGSKKAEEWSRKVCIWIYCHSQPFHLPFK